MNHKSYILAACFCTYLVPIFTIVGCYFFIVKAVFNHEEELRQQAKKMNVTSLRSGNDQQEAVKAEIRAAKVAIVNVTMWIVSWTPFTALTMVGTWYDSSYVTALMSEVPIVCAKTSAVFNPIIYALSHPKFRDCLKELYPWLCIVVDKKKGHRNNGDSKSICTVQTGSTSSVE